VRFRQRNDHRRIRLASYDYSGIDLVVEIGQELGAHDRRLATRDVRIRLELDRNGDRSAGAIERRAGLPAA
jgi:hypothetical protein